MENALMHRRRVNIRGKEYSLVLMPRMYKRKNGYSYEVGDPESGCVLYRGWLAGFRVQVEQELINELLMGVS